MQNQQVTSGNQEEVSRLRAEVTQLRRCDGKGYRIWTEQDLQIMNEHYQTKTPNEVAVMLNRSPQSVKLKAQKMGLSKNKWSPEEIEFLRKSAPTMTHKQIAEAMGRTPKSIIGAAYVHRISLQKTGDNNHSSKHSDHDVWLARELYEAGLTQMAIAEKLEIPHSTINKFIHQRYIAIDAVTRQLLPR